MSDQLVIKRQEVDGSNVWPTKAEGGREVADLAYLLCVKAGRLYFLCFDARKVSEQRARRSFRWHLERDDTPKDPTGMPAHYLSGKALFGERPEFLRDMEREANGSLQELTRLREAADRAWSQRNHGEV